MIPANWCSIPAQILSRKRRDEMGQGIAFGKTPEAHGRPQKVSEGGARSVGSPESIARPPLRLNLSATPPTLCFNRCHAA